MAITTLQLQARLDALDATIQSGALTVDYPDAGRITYRTLLELRQVRADIQAQINSATATTPIVRTRRVVPYSRSGF